MKILGLYILWCCLQFMKYSVRKKQHTKFGGGVPLAVVVSDLAFLILCGWLLNH